MVTFNILSSTSCPDGSPCPDPTCTEECPCDDASSGPIRYYNGEVVMSVDDLSVAGYGLSWGHTRVYSNRLSSSTNFGNGTNWLVRQWAYLVDEHGDDSEVVAVMTPRKSFWFDLVSGNYVGAYGARQALTHDVANKLFVLTESDGTVWKFHDFDQTGNPVGALASVTSAGGQTITLTYDSNDLLTEATRSFGSAVPATEEHESFVYAYNSDNLLSSVTLRRKTGTSAWSSSDGIRRTRYTYYGASSANGSEGDLEQAIQQLPNGSGWSDHKTHYYRYYKDAQGTGFQYGLKYVVEPDTFQQMSSASLDPLAVSDTVLDDYADYYFEFDDNQRVVKEIVDGGTKTHTFAYTPGNNTIDYNHWQRKTVETLPTGDTITVYTNHLGQVLLKEIASGADSWITYSKYHSTYSRMTQQAEPSAVVSYNDSSADLNVTLQLSSGLIRVTDYYDNTTATSSAAGSAKGYEKSTQVKQGSSGTPIKLTETTYFKRDGAEGTVFPVAQQTVYQSDASGGNDPATKKYAYTWHGNTTQILQKTSTQPAVPTAQNGKNVEDSSLDVFDVDGNLVWNQGARGFLRYHEYDCRTGALTQTIEDVDTTDPAKESDYTGLPSGWTTPTGAGLHLASDYTTDTLGRTTQTLGPAHSIDFAGIATEIRTASWTIFDDADFEVRSATGFQKTSDGTSTLVNPVSIAKLDSAGKTLEQIAATRASTAGALLASDTFTQSSYVRWTKSEYTDGQIASSKVYHTIPTTGSGAVGTNYDETTYGYDALRRQNRMQSPGGTITRTVFDARGLFMSTWIGTDDTGATENDPDGTGSPNNMKQVTANEYDGGADNGDGNLTKQTQYVDASVTRVTSNTYDWRNRLETTDGEEDFFSKSFYDNLGRVIKSEQYDTTAAGNLVARSETRYDDRGRVYQTVRHEVDPSTSTVGNKLTDNIWYDCCGNVIKQQPAGSEQFLKTVYDGLARSIKTYVGFDSDETSYAEVETIAGDTIFEQTEMTYDAGGNAIQTTVLRRYHDATATGALTAGTDSRPNYMASYFDGIGRTVAVAEYGNQGNDSTAFSRAATIPTGTDDILVAKTEYNDNGEAFKVTDPAGMESRSEFDDAGRAIKQIENYTDGNPTTGGADEDVTVETTYTADGQVATLKAKQAASSDDQTTTYVYGSGSESEVFRSDLLRATIYPDSDDPADLSGNGDDSIFDRVEYRYNRLGEVIEMKDQNGTVHEYDFDKLGRQTQDRITTRPSEIDNKVLRIARTYEVRGMAEKVTQYDNATAGSGSIVNQVQHAYNDLAMLATEYQEHAAVVNTSTSHKVQYGFDATAVSGELTKGLRPTKVTYPNGRIVHLTYGSSGSDADNLNRLDAINDDSSGSAGTAVAQYSYLGNGTVVKIDYTEPDVHLDHDHGTANAYAAFDKFGRTVDHRWTDYGPNPDVDIDQMKYGYDRVGNRTWRENVVAATNSKDLDEFYTYDGVNRLKTMDRGNLTGAPPTGITGTPAKEQDWTLDPLGNWTNFVAKTAGTTDLDQDRTHNQANELGTISNWTNPAHDVAGNMTTIPQPIAPNNSYLATYDAWNRLVEVKDGATVVQTNAYDGHNRRTIRDETGGSGDKIHYYYNDQWQVVEERKEVSGTEDTDPRNQYVYHPNYVDAIVLRDYDADTNGSAVRHYYLQDANFNVTAVTDDTGTVVERYNYTPYGEASFLASDFSPLTSSAIANELLYTGRRTDPETGLQLNRNRFYHQQLGRWVNRDPIGYRGGINLYGYVSGMPLIGLDPLGTKMFGCDPYGAWGPWSGWTSVPTSASGLCCYVKSRSRWKKCYFCWVWFPVFDTETSKARCCTPNPKRIGCVFFYGPAFNNKVKTGAMCP